MQAKFTFQKAGWMSGSKNEVIGEIKDEKNNKLKSMFGRWDEGIYLGENSQTVSRCFKYTGQLSQKVHSTKIFWRKSFEIVIVFRLNVFGDSMLCQQILISIMVLRYLLLN